MASHAQINKNETDVQNAYGQWRNWVQSILPANTRYTIGQANRLRKRRNYR